MDVELREAQRAYQLAPSDPASQRDLLRAWVRSGTVLMPENLHILANVLNSNPNVKASLLAFSRQLADVAAKVVDNSLFHFFESPPTDTFWIFNDETGLYPGRDFVHLRMNVGRYNLRYPAVTGTYVGMTRAEYDEQYNDTVVNARLDHIERYVQNTIHERFGLPSIRLLRPPSTLVGAYNRESHLNRYSNNYNGRAVMLHFLFDMPLDLGVARVIIANLI